MIALQISAIALSSFCFWLGGYRILFFRRYMMPIILGVTISILTHVWWLGLAIMPVSVAFSCGYGDNSIIRRIFGNGWGRSVWGGLAAICLSLPLFLTHHLSIFGVQAINDNYTVDSIVVLILYLSLNFTLENVLKNIPQYIGDPIIGVGFASIVLLAYP